MVAILNLTEPKLPRRTRRAGTDLLSVQLRPCGEAGPTDRFAVPWGVDTLAFPASSAADQALLLGSKRSTSPFGGRLARQTRALGLWLATRSVLAELSRIAFSDIGDVFDEQGEVIPFEDLPPAVRSAIAEYRVRRYRNGTYTVSVKMHSKVPALITLGRYLGAFDHCPEDGLSQLLKTAHRPGAPRSTQPDTGIGF